MGGKFEGQKLRETALTRDQDVQVRVANESRHFTLKRAKRYLVPCMVAEHLFLACTMRWGIRVRLVWRSVEYKYSGLEEQYQ